MSTIRKWWNRLLIDTWNIAFCEMGEDMSPVNLRWMKHDYSDRWFADPFFLEETPYAYVILVEEYMRHVRKGRLAKLIVEKKECQLVQNETLLDLKTHLSFPNVFIYGGETYIYPENSAAGELTFYCLSSNGLEKRAVIPVPLIDPVFYQIYEDLVLLLGTMPEDANGNILHVFKSASLFGPYEEVQQIIFKDNIARRAGNIFKWKGRVIAPAQVCNKHYGEGISFQEVDFREGDCLSLREILRLEAKKVTKMTGFHTYNVVGNKVVIDGYYYGNEFIHDLYFDIRGLKYK